MTDARMTDALTAGALIAGGASEFAGPGTPLTQAGFDRALEQLGAAPEALWAVMAVETSGCGYLPDRRPKILFERHVFHRITAGRYDASHPAISAPQAGGYGPGGAQQYARLAEALALDRKAALESTSWGLGQIMGANHHAAGFDGAELLVAAFVASEDAQLAGMASFVARSPMKPAIRDRDWATFARLYNGEDYAVNHYDQHLADNYGGYVRRGCPDLAVRRAQVYLSYLGFDTGGVDGLAGPRTRQALAAFQQGQGLSPADGSVTAASLDALAAAAPPAPMERES
jgi:hypothetical protein